MRHFLDFERPIASAAGTFGLFHLAAYTTAKHAVVGLVKGLAADLVATGVTAVAVSPGSTRTGMLDATADLYGVPDPQVFTSNQLLRRLLNRFEQIIILTHIEDTRDDMDHKIRIELDDRSGNSVVRLEDLGVVPDYDELRAEALAAGA